MKFFIKTAIMMFSMTLLLGAQNYQQNIIDDFEDTNPYNNFQINARDLSKITLNSTSDRKLGNYALEMIYYLKSTLPTGSEVSIERYFKAGQYPDIHNAVTFNLYIKGDGSGNVLRITLIDSSGEWWIYENKGILSSTTWEKLSINPVEFKLSDLGPRNNHTLDLDNIQGYKITIYNQSSLTVQGVAAKSAQGNVLLDAFFVSEVLKTEEKPVEKPVPGLKPVAEPSFFEESPVRLSGTLYGEYFKAKAEKNELRHWGKLDVNALYDRVSAKLIIASESQNFGDSAYRENELDAYTGQIHQDYAAAIIPFIQLRVNDISTYINNVTFGNIWFEYNKHVFSPTIGYDQVWGLERITPDWGYKGISTEGDLLLFNYHAFGIKGSLDSYTAGFRLNKHIKQIKPVYLDFVDLKFYFVDSQDTAIKTNENKIKKFADDKVMAVDLAARFFNNLVGLEIFAGYNEYQKTAQIDYADPYEPVYQQALDTKISEKDKAYKGKILFDGLFIPGVFCTYEFRKMGEEFKPKFRREPILYDDVESDQLGHNVLLSYSFWGLTLSAKWDELTRISDSDYYRKMKAGGISCNKLRNLFLSYYYEWKREFYEYVSMRSSYKNSRDDEIISQEFYAKAQILYNFDLGFKIRMEDIKWPKGGEKFNSQSLYINSNYYIANNFYVFGETRVSRFGDATWYSPGYNPYIDDFVRLGTRFDF